MCLHCFQVMIPTWLQVPCPHTVTLNRSCATILTQFHDPAACYPTDSSQGILQGAIHRAQNSTRYENKPWCYAPFSPSCAGSISVPVPVPGCPGLLTSFPRQTQHLLCGSLHLQPHLCLCLGTEELYLEQVGHTWAGVMPGVSPLMEQPYSC